MRLRPHVGHPRRRRIGVYPVKIAAIDPSLRRTGLFILNNSRPMWQHSIESEGHDSDSYLTSNRRVRKLAAEIRAALAQFDLDYAAIEQHPYAARDGKAHDRGLLWGAIFGDLDVRGVPCAVVNPLYRCAFITGKSRAEKDVVLDEVNTWWPGVWVRNHDIADAAGMAVMADVAHGGVAPFKLRDWHRANVDKVTWPDRRRVA